MEINHEIKPYKGHYILYINNEFYCTADDMPEAKRELKEYIEKGGKTNAQKANH